MYKYAHYPTPFLLVDLNKIRSKCRFLRSALPEAEIFYAMKANPEPRIVATMVSEGCGVEVSSPQELREVVELNVPTDKIISSNPIKSPQFLSELHTYGVELAFDSAYEVDKIAQYAPNSHVYLRIKTDNTGSDWPLSKKFGADVTEAADLLHYAAHKGLVPYGLTFHVGSQCLNPGNWANALRACAEIVDQVSGQLNLEVINLGGGLPIQHTKDIPELPEIVDIIKDAQTSLFANQMRYYIEPGRFLVGDSAVLVSSVVGKAKRENENWLYLDVGVYNGLMETIEHFSYAFDFDVDSERERKQFTIAGPSCDSMDTMFTKQCIPDLQVGERFYILNAGAYTTSYASHFNGFAPPVTVYTNGMEIKSP